MLPDAAQPVGTIEASEGPVPVEPDPVPADPEAEPVGTGLQSQLKRLLRPRVAADPVEKSVQTPDDRTTSGQDWIDALRRQK
jgi:hypothetical protein